MSIGQKQRIAIARAIVRNPSILILDEPTSNLDVETEKLIYSSLYNFIKSRTTIVITHRTSINLKFDKIIAVNNGILSEVKNLSDLLTDNNYSDLSKTIDNI